MDVAAGRVAQIDAPTATSVSRTACRSNAERLMTFSTSAVAVCCCSASVRSRVRACTSSNSRTFSIAITAWSAKVCTSSICRCVERSGLEASYQQRALDPVVAQQRHAERWNACPPASARALEFAVGERVANGLRLRRKAKLARPRTFYRGSRGAPRDIATLPNPAFGHRPISEHIAIANTDRPGPAADKETAEAISASNTDSDRTPSG